MQSVGVRELKENAPQLVRRVREDGESIAITYYGEVVARIVPVRKPEPTEDIWATLDALSAEIGHKWQGSTDINEIMAEERG